MKIPKSFQIMNNEYQVIIEKDLIDKRDSMGEARFRTNIIALADKIKHNIPDSQMERTFMHELIHVTLHEIKEDKLRDDERFVDILAGALSQAFNTMKY